MLWRYSLGLLDMVDISQLCLCGVTYIIFEKQYIAKNDGLLISNFM